MNQNDVGRITDSEENHCVNASANREVIVLRMNKSYFSKALMKRGGFKDSCLGFTLIEILIAILIIGILVAIAYPSYTQYKIRTNRAEVQTEMMQISQRLQAYQIANNNSFNGATLATLGVSAVYPTARPVYGLVLRIEANNQEWQLVATPTGSQTGNGVVCLNQAGQKFWSKGATACALSNVSNWDGR